jgi:hypothetical protein
MISITGKPYESLPTAFQYRESYNAACTCRPPGGYSVASARPAAQPVPSVPTTQLPRPRPAPGQDPETLANRAGDLAPRVHLDEGDAIAETESGIRIVGPAYWGAPQHDDALIAPVPN